ncbi:hypothetical protein KAFR_0G00780 [Kazachstania africana CBS 2517]|uniref:Carbamoyl phosphate synthase arginine-specific large chain n=1 Tax=Kazachstania africana (strain ATCC 22294 / BCRC 22015 / CBS 2517 / CECT 1963 / NBRC 1671 / NRRL Y-8276) TaxID=1071382 RepID=H2AXL1_KAZAF|nr:hypothetical protein KAFR_0G00780 [Kazachstania africana CBS 2517]CCF59111.1 hypothetical protein KAFR_0G00780 [Kazachstania africana CBS 2517]
MTAANPKNDIKTVLVIGSGGLSIGQAGEFDYSGSQAIKALKESSIKTILINPNIATNQTSHSLADKIYFLPIKINYLIDIIEKERPDGVLLTFGGQTALNAGIKLDEMGIFKKYNIKVLGTPIQTLITTEDRELFANALNEIDIPIAKSIACNNLEEAMDAIEVIKFPVIIRSAFALGGLGSGFANDMDEFKQLVSKALSLSPQVLVEKSMKGWKEVEYEVIRDNNNNCITVCNMENFDPLGVHTGDSIVVAPSQTLSDEEYHMLRINAIKIIRHLGVVGECNIQYALNPESLEYRVIEVNARLSRSSALASKATGYPLAYTAAKIALGFKLPDLPNPITKLTVANFEPSLDYIICKIPKWDLSKFQFVDNKIGSSMKSVGEVMAIGRNYEEAFQKALRQVDPSVLGFQGFKDDERDYGDDLDSLLSIPTDRRIFAIGEAMLHKNYTIEKIHDLTKIDNWFLYKLETISNMYHKLMEVKSLEQLNEVLLRNAKKIGFSDLQIAKSIDVASVSEWTIRTLRKSFNIVPYVKRIDTLAAEFPAQTNYLYTTYNASKNDVDFTSTNSDESVLVLGSGVYRIGSSVEFDWCAVNTVKELRNQGKKTVMINYNPETVSTDFDEVDRLYFDELSFERVMDIYEFENPLGCVVSVGGQLPQNIALPLFDAGCTILGTSPVDIDNAENRQKFSTILNSINVDQPAWMDATSTEDALNFAEKVNFPVLIRPSYVLSGAAMSVVRDKNELQKKLTLATNVSPDYPVVISKFIENSQEIDVDAVAYNGEVLVHAISEHVENAGIHSGDASLVLPPQHLTIEIKRELKTIADKVAKAWKITGPFNMQIIKENDNSLKVIECNIRASRSFPFVSKVLGVNFIQIAVQAFLGGDAVPKPVDLMLDREYDYVATKVPQFSFTRLSGADPYLGVEMASTGEVAAFGKDLLESYWTAIQSTQDFNIPLAPSGMLFGGDLSNDNLGKIAQLVEPLGYRLYVTNAAAQEYIQKYISNKGNVQIIELPRSDNRKLRKLFQDFDIKSVFNLTKTKAENVDEEDYIMRRSSIDFAIPLFNEPQTAYLLAKSLVANISKKIKSPDTEEYTIPSEVRTWDEFVGGKPI